MARGTGLCMDRATGPDPPASIPVIRSSPFPPGMVHRCMQIWPFLQGSNKGLTLGPSSRPVFPPYVPVRAARRSRSGVRVGDLRRLRRRVRPSCAYPPSLMGTMRNPAIRPGDGFPVLLNDGRGLNAGSASRLEPGYQYMAFCRSVDSRAQIMPISVLGLWPCGHACLRRIAEGVLAISGRLKSEWCPVLTFVECHGIFYLAIL